MKTPLGAIKPSEHYRSRAEECRTIAELLAGEEPKRRMRGVAETYERMAELAARLEGEDE